MKRDRSLAVGLGMVGVLVAGAIALSMQEITISQGIEFLNIRMDSSTLKIRCNS